MYLMDVTVGDLWRKDTMRHILYFSCKNISKILCQPVTYYENCFLIKASYVAPLKNICIKIIDSSNLLENTDFKSVHHRILHDRYVVSLFIKLRPFVIYI